jgi:hypothetical protein
MWTYRAESDTGPVTSAFVRVTDEELFGDGWGLFEKVKQGLIDANLAYAGEFNG